MAVSMVKPVASAVKHLQKWPIPEAAERLRFSDPLLSLVMLLWAIAILTKQLPLKCTWRETGEKLQTLVISSLLLLCIAEYYRITWFGRDFWRASKPVPC